MDFNNHIKKATDNVSLSHAEKARMRTVLQSYLRFKPASVPVITYTRSVSWLVYLHRPIAAALILVLVSTTGVSYAAESSLPGDALYGVKLNLNEPVKVALATSLEAKAEVQIELAERRLEEAATLAAEKRLDAETQQKLAVAFETHADSAAQEVEKIDAEDSSAAVELSSRFETRLATHDELFAMAQDNEAETDLSPSRLAVSIRDAGLRVANIRTRAEERLAVSASLPVATSLAMDIHAKAAPETTAHTTGSAESSAPDKKTAIRMRDAAEKQLKDAQKKVRSNEKKLDAEARVRVYDDLEYAEALIEDGENLLDENSIALAFHAFQEALVISERTSVVAKTATVAAKARSNRRDAETRVTNRASETVPAAASAKGGSGNADVEAALMIETATPTEIVAPETNSGTSVEATTAPSKFIPPSIQIFFPRWDEEKEESNSKGESDKGSGGIPLHISL